MSKRKIPQYFTKNKRARKDECYLDFINLIIPYVNAHRLLSYRLVCKHWNTSIKNNKQYIFIVDCTDKLLKSYMQVFNNIRRLNLMGKFDITDLQKLSGLQKLSINKEGLTNLHIGDSLRCLKINMHGSEKVCLQKICEKVASSQVTKLIIMNKSRHCDSCVKEYKNMYNLVVIKFVNYENIGYNLIETLMDLPNLQKLILYDCSFTFCPKFWKNCPKQIIMNKNSFDESIRKKLKNIKFI